MENRPEEHRLLEERGIAALSNALKLAPYLPPTYREEYRFWHYPAFAIHHSWTVLWRGKDKPRIIRRIAWDRPHDMRRFVDPLEGVRQGFTAPPTLTVQDRTITNLDWDALFADVAGASLPLLGFQEGIGQDSDYWGLAKPSYFEEVLLQWWSDGPTAWRPFTTRVITFLHQLEALFDEDLASG